MPRLPDSLPGPQPDARAHAAHDRELVAAYAAGDATGADLDTAAGLVATCAECSALHHDLRLIAAALPALPAPVRPRDFRITAEQAASLRPAGWRAILGTFAGPRFRFAAPLGTGLATLGLAGILLGSLAGAPLVPSFALPASGSAAGQQAAGASVPVDGFAGAPSAAPSAAPSIESGVPAAGPGAAGQPGSEPARTSSSGVPNTAAETSGPPAAGSPGVDAGAGGGGIVNPPGPKGLASPGALDTPLAPDQPAALPASPAPGTLPVLLGGVALLAGLTLLAMRWGSRRLA